MRMVFCSLDLQISKGNRASYEVRFLILSSSNIKKTELPIRMVFCSPDLQIFLKKQSSLKDGVLLPRSA
jgi:hypothetical protein